MNDLTTRTLDRAVVKSIGRPLLIGSAVLLLTSWCYAIDFNEIARFDLSHVTQPGTPGDINPDYIGNLPMALAWNGTKLYAAGFDLRDYKNVHGEPGVPLSNGPISIVEILNATATGIIASPTFGTPFGTITTSPNDRGYIALELKGNTLAAANDQGGNSPNAIQLFDVTDNSLIWNLSASSQSLRGAAGVTFDPGYPGGDPALGSGVAFSLLGSGRRALLNEADGAEIYDTSDGMVWLPSGLGSPHNPRDMAFDPATGDIYVIRNGRVHRADRTGDNSTTDRRTIVEVADPENVPSSDNGQHLAFMETTLGGDLLIYNDVSPPGSNVDAPFSDHVHVIDPDGNAQQVNFNFIGGGSPPLGDARYDFDFDSASQTLAVLDTFNSSISIFEISTGAPVVEGDYNANGVVDAVDYVVWRRMVGMVGENLAADGDGSGVIDQMDFDFWRQRFGNPGEIVSETTTVPEPATVWLFAAVCLCGWVRRWIRAR